MEGSNEPLPEGPRERPERPLNHRTEAKENPMNAIVSSLYRDLTCAAAAVLISLVIGASFVQSTATATGPFATAVTARVANA